MKAIRRRARSTPDILVGDRCSKPPSTQWARADRPAGLDVASDACADAVKVGRRGGECLLDQR